MTTPEKPCPEPTDLEVGRKAVELGLITEMQLRDLLVRMAAAQEAGDPPPRNMASALIKFGLLTQKQLDGLRGDTAAIRKKFGKYTFVRQLGRGGMGVVYEAIDTGLGRTVALKMLINNPQIPAEQAAVEEERFTREARLSANLPKHPGIVGVYESGVLEGRRYIAMEYIEGRRFEEWCSKTTGSLRGPVAMLRDTAVAVDHAHRHGVIHRDLKPANVLIDTQGRPHVTDFGLARQLRQDHSLTLTGGGNVMGTPTYISPEQAQGRKDVDRRTDIWALGVMLYEVLAGRPPFRGETPVDVMMKIVKNPVPYPSAAVTRVGTHRPFDKTIENICMKALAKEPKDRYSTAKLFADDISRWLKGETVEVATSKRAKPSTGPWIAAGVAVFAVVAAFLFMLSSSSSNVDKTAAEKRDRASTLVGQGQRLLAQGKNADALVAFGKALELDDENRFAANGKRDAEQRIAAGQAPRPAPQPTPVAPTPAPPTPTAPAPQDLVKKASDFVTANPKDIEGQIRVWQETRNAVAGTPFAAEAARELEAAIARRRQAMTNDLADLDRTVDRYREEEKFDTASDVLVQAVKRRDDPEWIAAIESRQAGLKKALETLYASVREQAVEAQKKGDASGVKVLKARVERWRISELLSDLDSALAAVVPAKPAPAPAPTPAPTPAPPDPVRLSPLAELPRIEGHRSGIVSAAFSPDGRLLITASFDQTVRLWELTSRTERATLSEGGNPRCVAFSPDGKWMAAGYLDGKVRVWESGKSSDRTIAAHGLQAIFLAFSPDSKVLASASTDGNVRLWDPVSASQKGQLEGHHKGAMSVCWSADGKLLAVACAERMVKLWEMPAGRERRSFTEGLEGTTVTVALSRNGKYVAASGQDPRICVWDVDTGKVRTFNGHAREVRAIACSPDGSWIASASADGTLRLWDAASGEMRASLQDDAAFFGVNFSRKGDVLVGCAGSGMVRLWDLTTLRPLKPAPK